MIGTNDPTRWPPFQREVDRARSIADDPMLSVDEKRKRIEAIRSFHAPMVERTTVVYAKDREGVLDLTRPRARKALGTKTEPDQFHVAMVRELDGILAALPAPGGNRLEPRIPAMEPGYFADFTDDLLERLPQGGYRLRGSLAGYLRVAMDEYPNIESAMLAGLLHDDTGPVSAGSIQTTMSRIRKASPAKPQEPERPGMTGLERRLRELEQKK